MKITLEETLLTIDDRLRFVLFGLQCALNVEFNPAEVERLYDEAEADKVSPKQYTFWQSRTLSVTGRVDHYEPDTVRLSVGSRKPLEPSLTAIVERAQYQVFHITRRQDIV